MTREETIEAIKVMQAWVDGKTIECYDWGWRECDSTHVNWRFPDQLYRIKPKSLEVWHWVSDSDFYRDNYVFRSKAECEYAAKKYEWPSGKAVRFVAQED